jgi:spermidine synthase
MTSIYTLTIFTSAFLLFLIQPMISKLLLPYLGGSPAVWNTSMMFFQTLLLLGYAYAHLSAKLLGARKQFWLHLAMIGASLAWLPVSAVTDLGFLSVENPVKWVLVSLFLSVGFPFLVLAANAPLLQFWLSRTNHKDAANPYFLYSASNVGSLLALLGYPFVIEPLLELQQQTMVWSGIFALFVLFLLLCGRSMMKNLTPAPATPDISARSSPAPTWRIRFYWIALAFCPSSLLLGVTTYITTDIASAPLFWIIPLSLYLLTFIMAFARKPMLVDSAIMAQAVLVPFVIMALAFEVNFISQMLILHLFAFFYIALGCHGLLARNKPDVNHLTEFFLLVSVGGMLGGVFNSLVAPLIFTTPIEYPLVLILSLLLRPPEGLFSKAKRERFLDYMIPVDFAIFLWVMFYAYKTLASDHPEILDAINNWMTISLSGGDASIGFSLLSILAVLLFIIFFIMAVMTSKRPVRFALTMAAMLVVVPLTGSSPNSRLMHNVIYAERNFFGVNRVLYSNELKAMMIMHGTTLHGIQSVEAAHRLEPVSYYGVLREPFEHLDPRIKDSPFAVLGLGAGSLACFATPGQKVDFYEIDPAVADIAYNTKFFTYLSDCAPDTTRVIMGDGRLSLAKAPEAAYGAVVIDVFSSDAIPMHLLTREALQVYKSRLKPHGMLMFNISNRHMDLAPIMAALAKDSGLKALIKTTMVPEGKLTKPSIWVVMAYEAEDFNALRAVNPDWKPLKADSDYSVWTDNYSNIIQTLF